MAKGLYRAFDAAGDKFDAFLKNDGFKVIAAAGIAYGGFTVAQAMGQADLSFQDYVQQIGQFIEAHDGHTVDLIKTLVTGGILFYGSGKIKDPETQLLAKTAVTTATCALAGYHEADVAGIKEGTGALYGAGAGLGLSVLTALTNGLVRARKGEIKKSEDDLEDKVDEEDEDILRKIR